MERIFSYTITENDNQKTIESFLKSRGYSHPVLVHLKKTPDGIMRNGIWAYTNEKLSVGDNLKISLIETDNSNNIAPIYSRLDIVYEDEDIMVINKPANTPIHPSMGNHENTLANSLMYYFNNQHQNFVFRCINRLDRDTTGLTIIAKHSLSAAILGQAVSAKTLHRTYTAICEGQITSSGTINAPIARKADSTIERCVDFETGETAVTHYYPVKYDQINDLSLVRLVLETGRTHQIRVHMKYIGHPLIGDFLYNPNYKWIDRQALHSTSLDFIHPITKKRMNFSVQLPLDMKFIL